MSDFFTHLAERTLGTAAVVQPLIAPRFAANLRLGESPIRDELSLPAEGTILPPPSNTHENLQARPNAPTIDAQPRLLTTPTPVWMQAPVQVKAINPQAIPPNQQMPPETVTPSLSMQQPSVTHSESVLPYLVVATRMELAAIPPGQASTIILPRHEIPAAESPSELVHPSLPAEPGEPHATKGYRVETHTERHPPNFSMNQATMPATTPPGAALPAIETESAPTPVIHVSIGRIEVRAVAATTPPPASRPAAARPAATLSLDEYLKRAGGSR